MTLLRKGRGGVLKSQQRKSSKLSRRASLMCIITRIVVIVGVYREKRRERRGRCKMSHKGCRGRSDSRGCGFRGRYVFPRSEHPRRKRIERAREVIIYWRKVNYENIGSEFWGELFSLAYFGRGNLWERFERGFLISFNICILGKSNLDGDQINLFLWIF